MVATEKFCSMAPSATRADLTRFLLDRALISESELFSGNVTMTDMSRRNRNTLVKSRLNIDLFVKQSVDRDTALSQKREFLAYSAFLHVDIPVDTFIPRLLQFDEHTGLLVIESLSDCKSLREIFNRRGRVSMSTARAWGESLARAHEAGAAIAKDKDHACPVASPWIFGIARPVLNVLKQASAATIDLIKIVQGSRQLSDALDWASQSWAPLSLIHGDMKPDNCLVRYVNRRARVFLVDWELAGVGHPLWDVGSGLAEYLRLWVSSLPFIVGKITADRLDTLVYPLSHLQASIYAFWSTYCARRGYETSGSEYLLVIRYTAIRLIQYAFERAQLESQISADEVRLLQLAANLITDPEGAATAIFGWAVQVKSGPDTHARTNRNL
jgi:hypothetical protein